MRPRTLCVALFQQIDADDVLRTADYPAGEDGTKGELRDLPRTTKDGEMEWVLLQGTPGKRL